MEKTRDPNYYDAAQMRAIAEEERREADDERIREFCGPVTRWRIGRILYGENNIISMAYVVDDDKAGQGGVVDDVLIEYISSKQAALWEGCGDARPPRDSDE